LGEARRRATRQHAGIAQRIDEDRDRAPCAVMSGAVACSSLSPSQEVLFPTADGATVVADRSGRAAG
jgi:hypothetical protein